MNIPSPAVKTSNTVNINCCHLFNLSLDIASSMKNNIKPMVTSIKIAVKAPFTAPNLPDIDLKTKKTQSAK